MKYNFDLVRERTHTGCLKWDARKQIFGREDIIPMWVADMDFPVAEPIVEALKKRAEHPFYGYSHAGETVIESIVLRLKRKFNWEIKPEWIVFTPGVVPALNIAVRSIARPGDEIILQEPVYYPFFPAVTSGGCHIASNPLKLINDRYEMDFEGLKAGFISRRGMMSSPSRIKGLILCNPHNPVGRLWERNELIKMGETVISNGGIVISDEIHCEILFRGHRHTPFAGISQEFEQNSITCMAPSKTFNLPGLEASAIIIPNSKLRREFTNTREGIVPWPNLFGLIALEAAFRQGDEWLEQLLEYLQGNLEFLQDYIVRNIPGIKVIQPQGTYLVWLDCRGLGLDDEGLKRFMVNQARVGLDDGYLFGKGGSGFQRMNIACPRAILEEALTRISYAVKLLPERNEQVNRNVHRF